MAAILGALSASPAVAAPPAMDASVYDRAAQFNYLYRPHYVLNPTVRPHWRDGPRERFTYRKELAGDRATFVEIDAATGKASPAFNAELVAKGLSAGLGKTIEAEKLPFQDYDEVAPGSIRFTAEGKRWTCSTTAAHCDSVKDPAVPGEVTSPDGKWVAFVKDGNLNVRSADGTQTFALTTDALPGYGYARESEGLCGYMQAGAPAVTPPNVTAWSHKSVPPGIPCPTSVSWSPDSRRIFTHRLDERKVREVTILQSTPTDGSVRPISYTWRSAMPNDPDVPMVEPWIFDVTTRTGHKVDLAPMPDIFISPESLRQVIWSNDGRSLLFSAMTRYNKTLNLDWIDAETGKTRRVMSESSQTFMREDLGEKPMIYPLSNGDLIWFSERTGYGHLYLYDSAGKLKRALTAGAFTVRTLLQVDEANGTLVIATNEKTPGADPYYKQYYRVSLKTGAMTLLTPEDADHTIASDHDAAPPTAKTQTDAEKAVLFGFSPSGKYFIDTFARTDLWPTTVLRRADGKLVAQIEQADPTPLAKIGIPTPERFHVLAADGKTVLYGNIIKPINFDPAKRYPLLDSIYPGPQSHRSVPNRAAVTFDVAMTQSLAELGFIVITVDGRGSQGRSKAFHDESYRGLSQAGHLDDHVAAIKELAAQHPYIDLDRVGIYGGSGGGYATAHAMFTFPDFFKVGVSDAGNHDQRGYLAVWGETYNGPEVGDNYKNAANATFAANLKGKLLLMHGDMDANVMPSLTLQVVDALIKANKDFDMLIVPNAGHTAIFQSAYAKRRSWDYLVRNLLGVEPPPAFDLTKVKPQ